MRRAERKDRSKVLAKGAAAVGYFHFWPEPGTFFVLNGWIFHWGELSR